jgi:hypothetical protein
MKNTIIVDIDTERERPILIGKGPETPQPTSSEEAKLLISTDIKDLCNALCSLIEVAHINDYANMDDMITASIKSLEELKHILQNKEETPSV